MYGWLETGGAFHSTIETDVVLRTANLHSQLTFGNASNTEAALYISNNNIGIKCPVDNENVVTINGNFCIKNASPDSILKISHSNIQLKKHEHKTVIFKSNGLIQGKNITANTYNVSVSNHDEVHIVGFSSSNVLVSGTLLSVDILQIPQIVGINFHNKDTLLIQENIYNIVKIINENDVCNLYLEKFDQYEDELQLSTGGTVNIQKITDLMSHTNLILSNIDIATYCEKVLVITCNFPSIYLVDICIQSNKSLTDYIVLGGFFHVTSSLHHSVLGQPLKTLFKIMNVVELQTSLQDVYQYQCTLTSACKTDNLVSLLGGVQTNTSLFLFNLPSVAPPSTITDENVVVGYSIDSDQSKSLFINSVPLALNSSQLQTIDGIDISSGFTITDVLDIPTTTPLMCNGLDTIIIDDQYTYNVLDHVRFGNNNSVIVRVKELIQEPFVVMRHDIKFSFLGTPIQITHVTALDAYSIDVIFKSTYVENLVDMNTYNSVYWIDHKNNIVFRRTSIMYEISSDLYTVSLSLLDDKIPESYSSLADVPFMFSERMVFIIPFHQSYVASLMKVGNEIATVYIPHNMCIGTSNNSEFLTVEGDASFRDYIVIRSGNNAGTVSFDGNILNMNNIINIEPDNVLINTPLSVSGYITCDGIYQMSDRRLKKNLHDADPFSDLEFIKSLKIKNFNMLTSKSTKFTKGIIAQDLETSENYMDILSKKQEFLKVAFHAKLQNQVLTLSLEEIDENSLQVVKSMVTRGSVIVIQKENQYHLSVAHISFDENSIYIHFEADKSLSRISGQVQVVGIIESIYKVDYNYLFVSAINAIKALASEMQALKDKYQIT